MRGIAAVILLSLVVLAPPARAAAPKRLPAVRVAVLDARQAAVLRAGAIRVRVASNRARRLRVRVRSGRSGLGSKSVRFRRRGVKILRVRLTRSGRRLLGGCTRRTLTARAGSAYQRTSFQRDPRRCRGTKDPRPIVLASSTPGEVGRPVGASGGGGSGSGTGSTTGKDKARTGELKGYTDADRCDPLDPSLCLYPFPNDHFTKPAAGTDTKLRVDLNLLSMPRNTAQKPIDPADYDRNDGFSPGSAITTKVPGLDNAAALNRTGAVPITDMARYADRDQAVVVIDTATGRRWPIWTELDANAKSEADRVLFVRPARNFLEGHRYVVALRDLRRSDGSAIAPTDAFRFYRDAIATKPRVDAFEARRPRMERIFADLAKAGIARDDLYLAWDFTVASRRNLSERVLQIRDDAFKQLGDTNLRDLTVQGTAPRVVLNSDIPDDSPEPCAGDGNPLNDVPQVGCPIATSDQDGVRNFTRAQNPRIARRVQGQIVVPCYLDRPGCPPGSRFAYAGPDATTPTAVPGNTAVANFICNIPRTAVEGGPPARPSLYGHGLFGSAGEVNAGNVQQMGGDHDVLFCATDWIGMSVYDVPNVATILTDLSNFSTLTDRVQQGLVNFLMLGRAMVHADGMCAQAAFRRSDGTCVIDRSRLFYDGNSQGGIIGGALAAVAVDHDRAVLGVPGMNYSTLLQRSADFVPKGGGLSSGEVSYAEPLYRSYPSELERPIVFSLIQMLWDRSEADGYAEHMTGDPLPNTPPHEVLMHAAFGDHQVANVTAETEARTIGAATNPSPLDPGRSPDVAPLWGVPRIGAFPYSGSALVYWDIGPPRGVEGTPAPPTTNTAPTNGRDPHGDPRGETAAQAQKSAFLRIGGTVVDPCAGRPCRARGNPGP